MNELTTEAVTAHRVRSRLASGYADRGWHVLPTSGKRPVIDDWESGATVDPDEARAAWDQRGEWAGCNIAVACGPSRLVVLDVDLKDGRDGFASLRNLGFELPETYSVRTPTGGLHLYYQAPPGVDIRSDSNVLATGIDIRAGGGIVVAAGSVNGKGSYEVNADLPVAALPTALAVRLATRADTRKLAEAIPDIIGQGERESVLVSLAGSMRRRGASPGAILAAISHENETRCEPPLEQADLERISNSMGRYAPAEDAIAGQMPDYSDPDVEVEIDQDRFKRLLIEMETQARAADTMRSRNTAKARATLGGMIDPVSVDEFIAAGLDPVATCIWGNAVPGGTMGWAQGQGTIIAGPPGTGKSTISLQLALRRTGILDGDVLGMPIAVSEQPMIYLAMDRADQIRQSIGRMIPEGTPRESLQRLRMLDNLPPTVDLRKPETFLAWLRQYEANSVVIDSIKDLGFDLNDSGEGQAFNTLVQATLRAGIQVLALHHSRKVPRGDRKPLTLNDLHGSQWVAAGAGSVLMLDGEAGPKSKRLVHVKPLTVPMPNLRIRLEPGRGEIEFDEDRGEDGESEESTRGGALQDRISASLASAADPMTPAALSRELGANPGSVSRALRMMGDRGLVERDAGGWALVTEEKDQ